MLLLLLFLTVPTVVLATPKCPSEFFTVDRTPTAKNNYTKRWCLLPVLSIFSNDRDYARGLCLNRNATLSMPENQEEFTRFSYWTEEQNMSEFVWAVDGEITPHCKAKLLKHVHYYLPKDKGECNIQNELFQFDDPNTDPSFMISKSWMSFNAVNIGLSVTPSVGDKELIYLNPSCLAMTTDIYKKNATTEELDTYIIRHGGVSVTFCDEKGAQDNRMNIPEKTMFVGTICGRPPL